MYSLIKRNDIILDAVDHLTTVAYCNGAVLISDNNPFGVSCDRTGLCYKVEGWDECPLDFDTVTLETCSKSVYEEEKAKLDRGEPQLAEVKEEVARHDFDIATLTGAIIEIGEILGGE